MYFQTRAILHQRCSNYTAKPSLIYGCRLCVNFPQSVMFLCKFVFTPSGLPWVIEEHFSHSLALTSPLVLRSGRKIKLLSFPFPYRTDARISMAASHPHSGTGQHFCHYPLVRSFLLLVSVLSSAVRQTTFLPCLKSSVTLYLSKVFLWLVYYVVVHMSIVWRWLGNGFITSEADPNLCVPHHKCSPLGA